MNTHEKISEMLTGFALHELTDEQSSAVKQHLDQCPRCKEELKRLETVLGCAESMSQLSADSQFCESAKEAVFQKAENNEKIIQIARPYKSLEIIRRIIMKSPITKLAAAAVIIIAVVAGIHFLGGPTEGVAWADVVRPILNAETAIFDIIVGEEEAGGPVIHDMVCGSRIRRTLSSMNCAVSIIDLESGKILSLDSEKKVAIYIDLKGLPSMPNYIDTLRNLITELQTNPNFQVEELGEREIQGQKLIGFTAKHPQADITIWADPYTALPVRIEQVSGQMKVICKNVIFDVPMDEELFSMDVPEGYKLEQTELDLFGATEEDFIEGLRVSAEILGDGWFPDSVAVEDYIRQVPVITKKLEEMELSDDEETEIGMKLSRHLLFIRFFKGEGKWHYAGSGVELGDADTAIFWYQPKDSETYRVIYGDLHVEDVAPDNMPK